MSMNDFHSRKLFHRTALYIQHGSAYNSLMRLFRIRFNVYNTNYIDGVISTAQSELNHLEIYFQTDGATNHSALYVR